MASVGGREDERIGAIGAYIASYSIIDIMIQQHKLPCLHHPETYHDHVDLHQSESQALILKFPVTT